MIDILYKLVIALKNIITINLIMYIIICSTDVLLELVMNYCHIDTCVLFNE